MDLILCVTIDIHNGYTFTTLCYPTCVRMKVMILTQMGYCNDMIDIVPQASNNYANISSTS